MQSEYTTLPEQAIQSAKAVSQRRHDVDWLRTLALGLLIIYHVVITFQPWGWMTGFIVNDQPIEWLWPLMSIINVWRIPILFLISGMGVRFAMQRRTWLKLLEDRTIRILVPFVFGFFFIAPIIVVFATRFYSGETIYIPGAGHLWFLANIFLYVICLLPLLTYWKNHPDNFVLRILSSLFRQPLGLFVLVLPVMLEAVLLNPGENFVVYAETWHGFWLGMVCFLTGFIFISLKDVFWDAVKGIRWIALILAFGLYLTRMWEVRPDETLNALLGLESMTWMLAILGFGSMYLNQGSSTQRYWSKAVYPVYIVHLPIQFILAFYIVPLSLAPEIKLILLLVGTFGFSILFYEVIRRIKWVRPLFGLKFNEA